MDYRTAYTQDLVDAAALLDSALIRRLTDNATIGMRVRAPKDVQAEPACLVAAGFAHLAELRLVFPDAPCALDLPPAALMVLGAKAIAASAQTAGFTPSEITLELDEQCMADLGDDALDLAERLKARGFCLRLNCTADAPFGLTQRARAMFSSAQAPADAALAASIDTDKVWTDPMARRLVSVKAAGLDLVADNARPEDANKLVELGFSAACFALAA